MKLNLWLSLTAGLALSAGLASAGSVNYTCAANIDTLGPANTCAFLNTTIASLYSSTFSNANANIYIKYGNTGLGSSAQFQNFVTYNTYLSALAAENGPGVVRAGALASLPGSEPALYSGGNVNVTAALAGTLGIHTDAFGNAILGVQANASTFCTTPGSGGCYDAVITLATPTILASEGGSYYYRSGAIAATAYDIYSVVEHETDEVLGTSSCVDTTGASLANGCASNGDPKSPSAADLYRYKGAGNRVFISSTPGAYFSYNGGVTNGANGFVYNTLSNGDDYADFVSNCPAGPFSIQDGEGCPGNAAGLDITNDGGAEINILDAVGYNLNPAAAVPEPATVCLLVASLGILGLYQRRRRNESS